MSNIKSAYYSAGISLLLLFFSGGLSFAQSKPITIGQSYEIQSAKLSEKRTLNVYLPEGYNDNDTAKYPVIYLLDGSLDEDFIHITGLVQFNSQPWVNRVPRSIVVGIANVDRKRDFTFPTTIKSDRQKFPTTGGSATFIAFIENEVRHFVKNTFRTNGTTTLIGESLGGLLATEILLTKPDLFDKYIIVSPSIWWNDGSLLEKPFIAPTRKTDIYIGVGKEGLTPGNKPRVMEVDANLLKEKIENAHDKNVRVFFDYLPEENHATISHHVVYNAFKVLYTVPEKK